MTESPPHARTKRLIIAPHADDEVLGCGGVLAKYPDECFVLVLGDPDEIRISEALAAKETLGYDDLRFLNFPDRYIGADMAKLVTAIDRVVNGYKPDVLYLPYPSMHQDHTAAYEAGIRSARMSMNSAHWFTPTVLVYDVAAYDLEMYPTDLKWNVFESLTEDEIDKKAKALLAYGSQQPDGPHPATLVKESAHTLGASRRVHYAEPFALVRRVVA